jgi:hypothetical protein
VENLREYAVKHAASWYDYIKARNGRGRELDNGDLYLVTGCEKARSWGMSSYHTGAEKFELAFKATARPGATYQPYGWSGAHGQRNPAKMKGYDPPSRNDPLNQTTFIHGWSISLPTGLWGRLFGTVETSSIVDFQSRLNSNGGSYTTSSQGSFLSWSWNLGGGSTPGGKQHTGESGPVLSNLSPIAKVPHFQKYRQQSTEPS